MKKLMCFILLLFVVLAGSSNATVGDVWYAGQAYLPAIDQETEPNLLPWSYRQGEVGMAVAYGEYLNDWDADGQWGFPSCYVPTLDNDERGILGLNNNYGGWTDPNALGGHGAFMVRWTSPIDGSILIDGYAVQTVGPPTGDPRVVGFVIKLNGTTITEGHVPYDVDGGLVNQPGDFASGTGGLPALLILEVAVGDTIDVVIGASTIAGSATPTFGATAITLEQVEIVPRYLTIATDPATVDSVTPGIGVHLYPDGQNANIEALDYLGNCPDEVWVFDHWVGDVNDTGSPSATVLMDADKTLTAYYVLSTQECPPVTWDVRQDWDDTNNPFQTTEYPAWTLIDPATGLPYPRYGTGGYGGLVWGPETPSHLGITSAKWGACEPVGTNIMGHGPWTVRWIAPDLYDSGNPYNVKIYAEIAQLWDTTRRCGIDVTLNDVSEGQAVIPWDMQSGTAKCLYSEMQPGSACTGLDAWGVVEITRQVNPGDVIDFTSDGGYSPGGAAATFCSAMIQIETTDAPPKVSLTINVLTDPDAATDPGATYVHPHVGTEEVNQFEDVTISADRFAECPEVLTFVEWIGDGIADPQSAATTVNMDVARTITVVYEDARACGDECHDVPTASIYADVVADPNAVPDCKVNLLDFSDLASQWLTDNNPESDGLPY